MSIWWDLFDYWELDDDGRQNLVALSQHSPDGYERANSIVAQRLKKKASRVWLRVRMYGHIYG